MSELTSARDAAIAFDTFGAPGSPPMLLIQGFSAQRLGWRPGFCQAVADEGYRVIRFDNRDVGQSQRYPGGGYDLGDMANDAVALLDRLDIASAHVVGQSMGGIIAQRLATEHGARVRSLGLLYTTASTRHLVGADAVLDRTAAPVPRTREDFIASHLLGEAACASAGYPQDIAWLTEVAGAMWDHGVDPSGVERQLQALFSFTDRIDEARTITVPTTIIAGDGDLLIDPLASAELHDLIAGSHLTVFPGMGHELPQALWGEIAARLAENARRADAVAGDRGA